MARLKLIEYLNNPALLETISEEEMIAWAKQVPYAGLVQRLLAQKLAIQSTRKELAEEATTMAIISNANPDQVIKSIKDFKNLILNKDVSNRQFDTQLVGHGKSDIEPITLSDEAQVSIPAPDTIANSELEKTQSISSDSIDTSEKNEEEVNSAGSQSEQESKHAVRSSSKYDEEEKMSDFASWLAGLQSIAEREEENDNIELENKELASSALAELLVSQGHNKRAIEMYEILILKNPQKSSFFADQIQKLKAL